MVIKILILLFFCFSPDAWDIANQKLLGKFEQDKCLVYAINLKKEYNKNHIYCSIVTITLRNNGQTLHHAFLIYKDSNYSPSFPYWGIDNSDSFPIWLRGATDYEAARDYCRKMYRNFVINSVGNQIFTERGRIWVDHPINKSLTKKTYE